MKVINRALYAALMALILMVTISFVSDSVRKSHLQVIAEESFELQKYEEFLPTRYYNNIPIMEDTFVYNNESFKIFMYEVVNVFGNEEDSKVVNEGLFFLIIGEKDKHENRYLNLRAVSNLTKEGSKVEGEETKDEYTIDLPFSLGRYSDKVPMFLSSLAGQEAFYNRKSFIDEDVEYNVEKLIINDEIEIEINFHYNEYILKNKLEEYIEDNGKLPNESVGIIGYKEPIFININKTVFIVIGIFIVFLIPLTYFIYRPRKTLGSKAPTKGLEQDISKIK